jgi:uncharacterized tellurite resistance protein B-like protein
MTTPQILLLVFLTSAAAVGFLYGCYRISPAGAWKHRLLAHIRSLQARQAALKSDSAGTKDLVARLEADALRRHLQTIPVEKLADYPNIGPATIDRLRQTGHSNLGDTVNAKFEAIAGIGAGRAASLVSAVRLLVKDARSRFHAGSCSEAQECRRQVEALRASQHERDEARSRELVAVEIALKESFDLYPLAIAVTFFGFLRRHQVPGLTDEIMNLPLPVPTELPRVSPAPLPQPAPEPPAGPSAAISVAAERSPEPAVLPPIPHVAPAPSTPADLFRDALNNTAKPAATATEHPEMPRMRAVIGFGLMMAKADGRIAQSEKKAIRAFLDATFGHDPVLVRNIDPLIEKIAKAIPDEAAALTALTAMFPTSERLRLLTWAEQIADASGERNQKERDALERIARALGVLSAAIPVGRVTSSRPDSPTLNPSSLEDSTRPTKPEPAVDPRAILDIAPDTSLDADLIRRRYSLLTEKLDPVRAAAFGPEFAKMAAEKRTRIRAAAETLIAPFGEPLEKPVAPPPADIRHNPDLDDVFGA